MRQDSIWGLGYQRHRAAKSAKWKNENLARQRTKELEIILDGPCDFKKRVIVARRQVGPHFLNRERLHANTIAGGECSYNEHSVSKGQTTLTMWWPALCRPLVKPFEWHSSHKSKHGPIEQVIGIFKRTSRQSG